MRNKLSKEKKTNFFEYGKVPPHAIELEEAVLGSCILNKGARFTVMKFIRANMFYSDAHQRVFEAITELFNENEPIDMLTVVERLKKLGNLEMVGGAFYVAQLTAKIGATANIEYHARIIFQKYIQRLIIENSNELVNKAFEDGTDVFELMEEFEHMSVSMRSELDKPEFIAEQIADEFIKELESPANTNVGSIFITRKIGFPSFDRIISWAPNKLLLLAGAAKDGKCFAKGTKIAMYDGSIKNIEDIAIGDHVIGVDSKPIRVTNTVRGFSKMYKVSQARGDDYVVNEDHILSLKNSYNGTKKNIWKNDPVGNVTNISIKEYLNKSNYWKRYHKGYKASIDWEHKDVSIDPYYLGLWLGDGNSRDTGITTVDNEIRRFLIGYAHELGLTVKWYKAGGKSFVYHLTDSTRKSGGIHILLRNLNLLQNKHIPIDYLINSKEIRLQLLAGLMDSDGHRLVSKNYNEGYEIIQKNKQLILDIKYLCDSLGLTTRLTIKSCSHNKIDYSDYYRLAIKGDVSIIPCKVWRKIAPKSDRNMSLSNITVEYVGDDNYYGISIDSEDERFMLSDFTVVHNTKIASMMAFQLLKNDAQTSIYWVTLEDTQKDIFASYLAQNVYLKPKQILSKRGFTKKHIEGLKAASEQWKKHDITFYDQSIKIAGIKSRFKAWCELRKDRFKVLIIDNLLSLEDKNEPNFIRNQNGLYDYVIGACSDIKRDTDAFIILLHHFRDSQGEKGNVESGFRPHVADIKGTEASRRIPNYILLLNNPSRRKELLNQYEGNKRHVLEHLMIIDPAAIRDEENTGDAALIRLYGNLNYTHFIDLSYDE